MSRAEETRTAMALLALESIPPTLRETLARDVRMRDNYGIQVDTILNVGDSEFSAPVSAIVTGVREALSGAAEATLRDTDGNHWSIEPATDSDQPTLVFAQGERHVAMHEWLTLSPDRNTRLCCLQALTSDTGLPPEACSSWRHILKERSLRGEEVHEFLRDLHNTTHVQEQFLANSVRGPGLNSRLAAPPSQAYFERLVGPRGESASIQDHAAAGARERLAELAAWRPYEGFLQSLYMASHPDLSARIRVDRLSSDDLVKAFELVLRDGDRVSQLGAIEVGCRVSADRPEVNPALNELVELMFTDDTTAKDSGFRGYSLLYVLVSSELSVGPQLTEEPPFYRRLAALAQAGVVQRQMLTAGIALKDSAFEPVVGEYFLRALVDLRLEPRRHPTLALANRLRAHFLGRIVRAADRYQNEVEADLIRELRPVMGPEQLRQAGEGFVLYAPGPLEELEEHRALPEEFLRAIEVQLDTQKAVAPADFSALRTSATSFRICAAQADFAANALTRSDYRLANITSRAQLLDTLASLASVAAIARSGQLADALFIVLRRYRSGSEFPITLPEAVQILMVAAASRADLSDWAIFVGDCLTQLAFGELAEGEGEDLHGYLRRFYEMVPELWKTCGSADAALMAYNGSRRGQGSQNKRADT